MKTTYLLGAVLFMASAAAAADVKETEKFTFEVSSGARISLENINGSIEITGGNGGTVEITAYKKAGKQEYLDDLEVAIDASDDYIRIETNHPDSDGGWFKWGNDSSGSVSYVLSVPADANLDVIETVNGDVEISDIDGNVKASTVNGSLEVTGVRADVRLETVNGSVKASFNELGGDQRVDAEAVNGRITLTLPGDASARIEADTVNGSIDADDFGLEVEKGFVGRELSGRIGSGDARVTLDTVNGSIRINKR